MKNSEMITLYHGSKSGIRGAIAPISRERCDFGRGFYMGTERMQPLTLICNYPNAKIYTLNVELSDLKDERNKLKQESEWNRAKGIARAEEICRKYRREGRFFDEILKAGD